MWPHSTIPSILLANIWRFWFALPVFIRICLVISLLAIGGIAFAVVRLFIRKVAGKIRARKMAVLTKKIHSTMMPLVFAEPDPDRDRNKMRELMRSGRFSALGLSKKHVCGAIVQEMVSYRNFFSGKLARRVRALYMELGFEKEALQKIHSKDEIIRLNALSELFKMDIPADRDYLMKLARDKSRYVREFARLHLIKFSEEDPLAILRETNEPISQWEDLEIFQIFRDEPEKCLPLDGLISLKQDNSIISLALQLAVLCNDRSEIPQIFELLETEDLKLRADGVAALGKLGDAGVEKRLESIYPSQPPEIKLEIIRAIGRIKSGESAAFLENEFHNSTHFEIKKFAAEALMSLSPSGNLVEHLMTGSDSGEQRILKHSLNPLINAQ